ncbi:hypothetical protein MD484_g3464, partial [Candolleomyces efflorescens]
MDSSPSSTSSLNHPASLVDPAMHSPHTLRLVSLNISKQLIDHVVDQVIETVDYAMGKSSSSTQHTRGRRVRTPNQTKFTGFVSTVLTRAEITTPTLLATLIYIHRARPYLQIALEEWALERVFLGALITASKYLNDSTLKNVHWALCTGVFGKRDVGRIEREFLAVLDWELNVSEHEILGLWQSLEWAVEMEEQEERRIREREEQQQRKMFFIPTPKEQQPRRRAVPSSSHSPTSSSSSSSRSSSPPSSASSSSSSSLSSPRTPVDDFELGYPSAEELARMQKHHHDVTTTSANTSHTDMEIDSLPQVPQPVVQQKRCVKRSFGTSAMVEMLKSFPFPGHHHHHHHQQHPTRPHPIRA